MISKFDKENIGAILADKAGTKYTWTTAHVLRFLNLMFSKGIDTFRMARLYELFPEETIVLLNYWGWDDSQIKTRITEWNITLENRANSNLVDKIMQEFG